MKDELARKHIKDLQVDFRNLLERMSYDREVELPVATTTGFLMAKRKMPTPFSGSEVMQEIQELKTRFEELYEFLKLKREIVKTIPEHGVLVKQGANGKTQARINLLTNPCA